MKNKIKVLFIVSEFYQAGTQRFTFELDSALNKDLFDVTILSILPLENNAFFSDFYYPKHKALGSIIYFWNEVDLIKKPSYKERFARKILGKNLPNERQPIISFLENFDVISVMGEYNFQKINSFLSEKLRKRVLIHIMNSRFQSKDIYSNFKKSEFYNFVSGFGENQIAWELEEFTNFKHFYFNLNFKLNQDYKKENYKKSSPAKIGVFTRLTYTKPIDPFIYSFKNLIGKIHDAELHIYGNGDPIKEGVQRYVQQLKLDDAVFFRGHQNNILKTAIEDDLDLIWFHGYHGIPGGFAGFDMCTARIPQLFWNFGAAPGSEFLSSFPMFNDPEKLADYSIKLLNNPEDAQNLAIHQYEFINSHFNIENNVVQMENLYLAISQDSII